MARDTEPYTPSADLLTPDQAARRAGRRRRAMMDALRRGDLSGIVYSRGKDGRVTAAAFDPADVDAYIRAHRQEASR